MAALMGPALETLRHTRPYLLYDFHQFWDADG